MTHFLSRLMAFTRPFRRDRKGAVAMMVGGAMVPMLIAVAVGIDFSRLADGRASLQRAVDNAALSGAAAYSINAQGAQTRAGVEAVSAFCETTAAMPMGFTVTGSGTQGCAGANGTGSGPVVTTQVAGYKTGTPGIIPSACSINNPIVGAVNCGFVVTVTAQATMNSMIPAFFGVSRTVSATGIAANPFLNIGKAISAQINGSARYQDSIWIYPLLLDANGNPDFSTNAGAVPQLSGGIYPADASPSGGCASQTNCGSIGTAAGINCSSSLTACGAGVPTGCTDNPMQFTCGAFTELANTYYNNSAACPAGTPCYPNGPGTYPEFISGVVQDPQAPQTIITATTPLGIAYESQSGASQSYGYSGISPTNPLCSYPYPTIYNTVAQVYGNNIGGLGGNVSGGMPAMDWPKVTHWFYSSYLANGYAPTEGEILSESQPLTYTPTGGGASKQYNTRIPSIGSDLMGPFTPTMLTCGLPANSGDEFLLTAYPTTGATNGALFIGQAPGNSGFVAPSATGYSGRLYTPAGTPGYQYAALSCQSFGTNQFTFYWNDMGGNALYPDDLDYNNGSLIVQCSGPEFVVLIG